MKTLEIVDEARLLARARDQATFDAALAEVFRCLREPVFALCLHLTGNRAQAEDASQETFLAVRQGLRGFRGEAKLSTWVYRIAVRMAHRARGRPGHGELSESLADPAPGPELDAATRERTRQLLKAMDSLPAEQRLVLALFAVEGLKHGEIAAVLGIPEGTVWSRLHAARRRLGELLGAGVEP